MTQLKLILSTDGAFLFLSSNLLCMQHLSIDSHIVFDDFPLTGKTVSAQD